MRGFEKFGDATGLLVFWATFPAVSRAARDVAMPPDCDWGAPKRGAVALVDGPGVMSGVGENMPLPVAEATPFPVPNMSCSFPVESRGPRRFGTVDDTSDWEVATPKLDVTLGSSGKCGESNCKEGRK